VSFWGAKLDEADFGEAVLTDSDFSNALIRGARFNQARLVRCRFARAGLVQSDFSGASFDDSTLREIAFGAPKWETATFDDAARKRLEQLTGERNGCPVCGQTGVEPSQVGSFGDINGEPWQEYATCPNCKAKLTRMRDSPERWREAEKR